MSTRNLPFKVTKRHNDASLQKAKENKNPKRFNDEEIVEKLRQFDLSTKYGPCAGMNRLDRWFRAQRFHLHPPIDVFEILIEAKEAKRLDLMRCVWDDLNPLQATFK